MARPSGNGPTKATIDTVERRDLGWVLFSAGKQHPPPDDALPALLSQSLIQWQSENPERRVRATLGIVAEGRTVALHVWHDESSAS